MVTIDDSGAIEFAFRDSQAGRVEVVANFSGWHEEAWPMVALGDGRFELRIDPGPGQYLFRYRIDGERWRVDLEAHGVVTGVDGLQRSRAWRPPMALIADPQAA